jgi:hypothetical protein
VPGEELRERGSGVVADTARNFRDAVIARLEERRRFVHPPRDQVAKHRLADELREARRERGATKADPPADVANGPRLTGLLVEKLQRLADVRVAQRAEPATFAGSERLDPAPQDLDEQDFRHPRDHRLLPRTLVRRLAHHATKNRLEPRRVRRLLEVQLAGMATLHGVVSS